MDILAIDQNLLIKINSLAGRSGVGDLILRIGGVYFVYLIPIALIVMWFVLKKDRFAVFMTFLSGIFSWLVLTKLIISHLWYRPRPDMSVVGVKELLFHRPDYSFPSDHITMLSGLTFGLYLMGLRKYANWALAVSIIVGFCRIAIGVHFPLDIVGGFFAGLIGAIIITSLRKPIEKFIYNPLLKILKLIKLA